MSGSAVLPEWGETAIPGEFTAAVPGYHLWAWTLPGGAGWAVRDREGAALLAKGQADNVRLAQRAAERWAREYVRTAWGRSVPLA